MAIKVQSTLNLKTKSGKNLFSKLQGFGFTNFMQTSFVPPRVEERGSHLDLESQEILALLKSNVEKLADASSRMEFMMGELSSLMKKGL